MMTLTLKALTIQAGKAESEIIIPVQIEEQKNCKGIALNEGEPIDNAFFSARSNHEPESPGLSEIDKMNLSIEDWDQIIFQIHDLYPGRKSVQKRINIVNDAGVLFNGRQWLKKNFQMWGV